MSNQLLAKWHAYMENPSADALSEMLHDDVTFIHPSSSHRKRQRTGDEISAFGGHCFQGHKI